jgi:hypothetical protein
MKKQNTWAVYRLNAFREPIKVVAVYDNREDARADRRDRTGYVKKYSVAKVEIKPLIFD